ncbi:MAG: hypothetical protein WC346_11295 [Methanogenium sp.]|jgi:hypothetical protein
MTVKQLKNHLDTAYQDEEEIAVCIWSAEDVKTVFEQNEEEITLTDKQINDVLKMASNYDAEIGINWDFIRSCIDEVASKQPAGQPPA